MSVLTKALTTPSKLLNERVTIAAVRNIEEAVIRRHGDGVLARLQGKPGGGEPDAYGDTGGTPVALTAKELAANPGSSLAVKGNQLHLLLWLQLEGG